MADDKTTGNSGDAASTGDGSGQDGEGKFDLVVGKSTDKFYLWQQIPAWVLGGAAIVGGGVLIALPKHQTPNAWAAVIVCLFLAGLLSYRSAFTLNDGSSAGSKDSSPVKKPAPGEKNGADAKSKGSAAPTKPPAGADRSSGAGSGSGDPAPATKQSRGAGDDEPTSRASATPHAEPGASS
jgi:hypothetical protein